MQDSPAALMKRAAVALGFALAFCGPCGAFLPPLAVTTLNRGMSSPTSVGGQWERIPRRNSATAVRMAQEPVDEELQLAVRQLAAQVEDLRAIVMQLAEGAGSADAATSTSSQAQNINGATVDSSAAVPAVPPKAAKGASAPLVGTSGAQERIEQWVQESGGGQAAAPPPVAAAAAPVAAVAPAAPAVVPPPVVAEVVAEVAEVAAAPAAAAPADPAPAGSHKVKIEWEGAIHEVNCDGETTLLEAAMDAGLELPSSCMSGSCLTCPGKIVSGTVDQSEGVLEEEQTEAGFLLTCVSYPLSDVHFAVVDEEDLP